MVVLILNCYPCAKYFDAQIFTLCRQEAQQYADENSLLFMETSAKTAQNVNEIFLAIGNYKRLFCTILLNEFRFQTNIDNWLSRVTAGQVKVMKELPVN